MPKFGAQIDTQRIPVKGLSPESGTTYPTSPTEGMFFHRTDLKKFYVYLNSAWQQADNQGLAASSHMHAIADVTGLTAALADKVEETRSISAGTGLLGGGNLQANRTLSVDFAATGASSSTQAVRADDSRLSDTRTPKSHGHAIADVTNLQSELDLKAAKSYVDAAVQGLSAKAQVRVATTGNISLTGTQTIDGTAVVAGDRVLVKNQSTPSQNGIHVAAAGAWSRSTDNDTTDEMASAYVFVATGTANKDTAWLQIEESVTVGTNPNTWDKFAGAGTVEAGAGLSMSGKTMNVGGSSTIQVNADTVQIHPSYVAPITAGGTGGTTASSALKNLGGVRSTTVTGPFTFTAGQYTNLTITELSAVSTVRFVEVSSGEDIELDIKISGNVLSARSDVPYGANSIAVVCTGPVA